MTVNKSINEVEGGRINISDDVLRTIANIATAEIEGVNGLYGGFTGELGQIFKKKDHKKGVEIDCSEESGDVAVNLSIIADFGISIPRVCKEIQIAVKDAVYNMTEIRLSEVNINVVGVNHPPQQKKKETINE